MVESNIVLQDMTSYSHAMTQGLHSVCARIESRYGLFGYPPELVTVGLRAIADDADPFEAIEAYCLSRAF